MADRLKVILGLAVIALFAFGCGSGGDSGEFEEGKVELSPEQQQQLNSDPGVDDAEPNAGRPLGSPDGE